jgi:hypothetical protein
MVNAPMGTRKVLDAVRDILRHHPMGSQDLRMVCPDSWDLAHVGDRDVADFLDGSSFAVVPEGGGGGGGEGGEEENGRVYSDGRSLAKHFKRINPRTSPNPWTKEIWRDHFHCDPDTNVTCANLRLDPSSNFYLDSKLEFVVEAVLLFSEAFERLFFTHFFKVNIFDQKK